TSMHSRRGSIGLTKAIKNVRLELRSNADARISYRNTYPRIGVLGGNFDSSFFRCELHRIAEQVPENLLQAICISQNRPGKRSHQGLKHDLLCFRGRTN